MSPTTVGSCRLMLSATPNKTDVFSCGSYCLKSVEIVTIVQVVVVVKLFVLLVP